MKIKKKYTLNIELYEYLGKPKETPKVE